MSQDTTSPINVKAELENLEELYSKTINPRVELEFALMRRGSGRFEDPTKLMEYKEYLTKYIELRDVLNEHAKKVNQIRNQNTNIARHYVSKFNKIINEMNEVIERAQPVIQALQSQKAQGEEIGLKSLQDYEKNAENDLNYIRTLQGEAKEIFQTRGPLCDSEGFYQHTGECWSDALQQVILNTDGIKERVQLRFIHFPIPNLDRLPDEVFVPFEIEDTKFYIEKNRNIIQNQKKWAKIYLQELQKRFLRHYTTEGTRRSVQEKLCKLREPADVARAQILALSKEASRRKTGQEGQTSAILGRLGKYKKNSTNRFKNNEGYYSVSLESYRKNPEKYAGGSMIDNVLLLRIFQYLMFNEEMLQFNFLNFKDGNGYERFYNLMNNEKEDFLGMVSACLISIGMYETKASEKNIPKRISGHESAFYICGKTSQYYENNTGVINFTWKKFLKYLFKKAEESPRVEFYEFFHKSINLYYINEFYPVIVCSSTGKKYTFYQGYLIEFTDTYKSNDGSIEIKPSPKYPQTLDRIIFIKANPWEGTSNQGFQPEIYSRIRKEPIVQALAQNDINYIKDVVLSNEPGKEMLIKGNEKKITLFHVAVAQESNDDMLDFLLSSGADINAQTYRKVTPLMIAVEKNNLNTVRFLCKKGADTTLKNDTDKTALDLAETDEMKNILSGCGTSSSSSGGRRRARQKTKKIKKKNSKTQKLR